MQKSPSTDALREIAELANKLRAAQEEVARLTTELWKKFLVLAGHRVDLEMPPLPRPKPATPTVVAQETIGLVDFDRSVFDKRPPAVPVVREDATRPSVKDKHAGAETLTNKIMVAIHDAGRPLRADEIHTAIGSTSSFASTQSTMSSLSNNGFVRKDDRQRPALWSLGPPGLDRVRRIKELGQ